MAKHGRSPIREPASRMIGKGWIDSETGAPYAGFEMGDMNLITKKNILKFQNGVIVLDDMGDKFNEDIVFFILQKKKIKIFK